MDGSANLFLSQCISTDVQLTVHVELVPECLRSVKGGHLDCDDDDEWRGQGRVGELSLADGHDLLG